MRVLTENEVRQLAARLEPGARFTVPADALLTPLARDFLRERKIDVIEPAARQNQPAVDDEGMPLEAVASERPGAALPAGRRAVVWAIGGDRPGILAAVAELLGRRQVNIVEISQTVLSGVFAMVVIVDLGAAQGAFAELKSELEALGQSMGINLSAQRDEIFQYMHRI